MGDLRTVERLRLAAHPLKPAPNRVYEAVFGVAEKAPHRLVLTPGVLEDHESLPPLEGCPEGSLHPSQRLWGL
jgi:hypothetical protein